MNDRAMYAVFLHPQGLEALGASIKPYLVEGPAGPHLMCAKVDAGGALFEMLLIGKDGDGKRVEIDLMVPTGMVMLVASVRRDGDFGFGPRDADAGTTPEA